MRKSYFDVIAAAAAAKTAVRMLRAELGNAKDMASDALENLNDTISIIDDESHPMKHVEVFLFGDFRWPHRNHWDQWAWSIEQIADACGLQAQCSEKYDYLRVEIIGSSNSRVQNRAVLDLANYVELISDYEILAEIS